MMVLVLGCANSTPRPDGAGAPSAAVSAPPPASAAAAASESAPAASAAAVDAGGIEGGSGAAAAADGGAPAIVADNKVSPTEGAELQERAKGLFEAIVKDEPALGDPFWFPKEPFVPLKDVKDPGRYWETLHKTYVNDIHALHRKRKSWAGATFVRFDRGSTPKWVKPGDEANKIGYYRSFHGLLRFEVDGERESIDVHTVITWQGRWFITHLRKFKK
jgi:hypothetical protein